MVENNSIIPSDAITRAINLEMGFEKFPDRASTAEARPHAKQINPRKYPSTPIPIPKEPTDITSLTPIIGKNDELKTATDERTINIRFLFNLTSF